MFVVLGSSLLCHGWRQSIPCVRRRVFFWIICRIRIVCDCPTRPLSFVGAGGGFNHLLRLFLLLVETITSSPSAFSLLLLLWLWLLSSNTGSSSCILRVPLRMEMDLLHMPQEDVIFVSYFFLLLASCGGGVCCCCCCCCFLSPPPPFTVSTSPVVPPVPAAPAAPTIPALNTTYLPAELLRNVPVQLFPQDEDSPSTVPSFVGDTQTTSCHFSNHLGMLLLLFFCSVVRL